MKSTSAAMIAALGLFGQEPRPESESGLNAPRAQVPTIAIKETAPVRVALIDHVGPYWSTGPVVALVREKMTELNESGPLFVRYVDDPGSSPADSLRSQIGFVLEGAREPGGPFQVERQPGRMVAYLLLPASSGITARHHSDLYAWAKARHHEPIGPLTELYWPSAKPFEREIVEIQLAIRSASADLEPAGGKADNRDSTPGPPVSRTAPIGGGVADAMKPGESPPAPFELQEIGIQAGDSGAPAVAEIERGGDDGQPTASVTDLYESGQLEAIAGSLIPDRPLPPEQALWLKGVVLRLSALSRGLEKTNSLESDKLRSLIAALRSRYDGLASTLEAAAQPVNSSIGRAGSDRDRAQAEVMRDLDRLLGRVAMGSLEPGSIERECIQIVTRAVAILTVSDG